MDWLSAVDQLRRDGVPGVLVTVIKVRGHAPRDAGAKMVVGADHSWGSVGGGNLEHPIQVQAKDEIGDLARSFAGMTENLQKSRAEMVRLNGALVQSEKLASIGEMAAAVAHGLRNPLASLRASAQLALRHPDSPAAYMV